ncbi:MAG: bifunctional 4-hydroxy-2-oxoglutarate aldolase/2-dehydro-3-deoxy-phosphogluconate aldolase [Okeania sp. SIO2H7]|nr:bifunctional 4-hydroxy-2-oxoglutarate aldolase/2-dehydro-3-deoxy-phosphogluconate aldolase [Okeania sp. SIO2H7]
MNNYPWLNQLKKQRAIAVIRYPKIDIGWEMAKAVSRGGIRLIEITWNSEKAQELIVKLREELPHCTIGAGTILNKDELERAIAIGCQFLFSPYTNPELIKIAQKAGVPIIPGALSPTEIVTAWQSGATCVKVFPISAVGGAAYLKSLQGPLDQIPLIPTGGVTIENAREFIAAGAVAVALGGNLFPPEAIAKRNWEAIAKRTQFLLQQLNVST